MSSAREIPVLVGVYGIARYLPDLDLPDTIDPKLGRIYEVGVSFSTNPVLELGKMRLPWMGIGYRWGTSFRGYRVSFSFPF